MDRAALYCRLSKEDTDRARKGEDSESIQNQKLLLMDYALEHNMLIYRIYSDDDYSGTDRNRPEWNRMLEGAKKGDFNIILCKTQSRFTRDMEMVERYIHGLLPEWGVRFIGVVDGVDTDIQGNKKARQINGLVNEWYLEDLSNSIKAVFHKKMEDGQFLGAFAPFGYKTAPEDRHRIIIDEAAAEVVKQIFSLYLEGYSIKGICTILTELQLPTPTTYKQSQGYPYKNPNSGSMASSRGVWGASTVRGILSNTTYIGVLTQGKEKRLSYKSKRMVRVPEREWYVKENNHDAIIERSVFEQVQRILASRRTVSGEGKNTVKWKAHCLAGKVKCPDCGSSLNKTGGGSEKSRYLRCRLAGQSRNQMCTPHSVRLNQLIDMVAVEIRMALHSVLNEAYEKDLEKAILDTSLAHHAVAEKKKALNRIIRIIRDNQEALAALYLDKVRKVITEEEYNSYKERFGNTLHWQQTEYSKVKSELEEHEARLRLKPDTLALAGELVEFTELSTGLVTDFIDYIEVGEDKDGRQDVHIYWNI